MGEACRHLISLRDPLVFAVSWFCYWDCSDCLLRVTLCMSRASLTIPFISLLAKHHGDRVPRCLRANMRTFCHSGASCLRGLLLTSHWHQQVSSCTQCTCSIQQSCSACCPAHTTFCSLCQLEGASSLATCC